MTRKAFDITLTDFTGGLNDNEKMNAIADNELSKAHNVLVSDKGIGTRGGFDPISGIENLKKSFVIYKTNGLKSILHFSDTAFYEDTTQKVITDSVNTDYIKCITYKNTAGHDVVVMHDNGFLKVYNGSSIENVVPKTPSSDEETNLGKNDLSSLTNVRAATMKDGRFFIAGHPTKKNMIHYSAVDLTSAYADYTYFPANFSFVVSSEDNDEICCLKVFREHLIVFCKRNIYAVKGYLGSSLTEENEIVKLNVESGVVAPDSICEVENSIFYMSELGVYEIFNTDENYVSARKISDNITNTLKTVTASTGKAVFYDNKYILNFDEMTFVYDVRYGCWVTWGIGPITNIRKDGDDLYIIKAGNEMKYNPTSYKDGETIFHPYILTKSFDYDYIKKSKKIKRIYYVFEQYLQSLNHAFVVELWVDSVKVKEHEVSTKISGVFDEALFDETTFDFQSFVSVEKKTLIKGNFIQLGIKATEQSAFHIFNINLEGSVRL